MCILKLVIHLAAALALLRLWGLDYKILWWGILGSALLTFWTTATVRTAFRQALRDECVGDPIESQFATERAKDNDVVRFWVHANMIVTLVTLILACLGLVLSFKGITSSTGG